MCVRQRESEEGRKSRAGDRKGRVSVEMEKGEERRKDWSRSYNEQVRKE